MFVKNKNYFSVISDWLLLPPSNEVWGKVIFLHLFVILFTGGRWLVPGGCLVLGVPAPGGVPALGVPASGGMPAPGGLVETPPTATAAGRTHPTGMHSCYDLKWHFTEQNRQMTHINVSKWAWLLHGQENYPKLGKKFMQGAQSEPQFWAASLLRVKFNFLNRICLNEASHQPARFQCSA